MTLQATELFDSRKIRGSTDRRSILLKYLIWSVPGTGDDASEVDIFNFAFDPTGANAGIFPYTIDGLNRASYDADNIAGPGGIWMAWAEYGSQYVIAGVDNINTFNSYAGASANLGVEYMGDTTGKPLHITQALATSYAISSQAADVISSGVNLTVTGANALAPASPDAYVPQNSDIGGIVVVSPSQGWPGQVFTITGVSSGSWLVNPTPGSLGLATGQASGAWTAYSSAVAGANGGSAPNTNNAIGLTLDGVKGCDIFVPVREYTISGVLAPYTTAQQLIYESLANTVNKAPFRGRAAGEVLYMGICEQNNDLQQFRLAHKFAINPNQYNLVVTPSIIVPFKAGWDLLDVVYLPGLVANLPIQVPVYGYVRQVYPRGDFTQFPFS